MFEEVFLKTILSVLSAIAGASIIFFVKLDHKKLCSLISVSAGALLGAAVIVVFPELAESGNWFFVMVAAVSGYGLFWGISKYFFHVCPACSASHFDEQTTKRFSEIVRLLFTALSFHSFLDGVALGTSAHIHEAGDSIFLAVITHKLPEGLTLASLMLGANYKRGKIVSFVFLVEATTILGGIVGSQLVSLHLNPLFISLIEANVAGGFVFLAFHAIFGELLKNHKTLVVVSFLSGLLSILALRFLLS